MKLKDRNKFVSISSYWLQYAVKNVLPQFLCKLRVTSTTVPAMYFFIVIFECLTCTLGWLLMCYINHAAAHTYDFPLASCTA